MEKEAKTRSLLILLFTIIVLILIFLNFILLRVVSDRQVDDVSPGIFCEKEIIDKSDILMVIPFFNNISIADNSSWCNYILSLNKTLGMHGVYHNYQEFLVLRDKEYIQRGMEEFRRCFGYYPKIFEAPQLALSKENLITLISMNLTVYGYPFQMTHKVYHCSDTGKYSNHFIDIF